MKTLLKSPFAGLLTKEKKEVQALVVGYDYSTGNVIAQVDEQRALIAPEDISIYQKNLNNKEEIHRILGTTVSCTVLGKNRDNDILLSRRSLMQKKLSSYKKGDVIEGVVYSASSKALYLSFDGGLSGILYTNKLTSSQVERPLDLYNIGDRIRCVITNIRQEDGFFDLSRLELYKQVHLDIQIGNILKCRITKKEQSNTGYYVEVLANPAISGIFDINQFNEHIKYKVGQILDLRVVNFRNQKQLKLRTIKKQA